MFAFTRLKCLWNVFSWIEKYFGSNGNELNTNCMFFDWLSGCCYDTGQHTRPSHWLPKCSQVLCFTHKMCSRGFVIVRHVNQAGWRSVKGLLGESYGEEGSQPSLWFIGHRCSVSAPVDASSSNHHFSSTSALTPSIANILIQTPSTISPVFSCKTNFEHFKPQTNKSTNLLCELTPLLTGIANPTLKAWNKVP